MLRLELRLSQVFTLRALRALELRYIAALPQRRKHP
jgi:hypothetical protein